jgi:hypothetical protein
MGNWNKRGVGKLLDLQALSVPLLNVASNVGLWTEFHATEFASPTERVGWYDWRIDRLLRSDAPTDVLLSLPDKEKLLWYLLLHTHARHGWVNRRSNIYDSSVLGAVLLNPDKCIPLMVSHPVTVLMRLNDSTLMTLNKEKYRRARGRWLARMPEIVTALRLQSTIHLTALGLHPFFTIHLPKRVMRAFELGETAHRLSTTFK